MRLRIDHLSKQQMVSDMRDLAFYKDIILQVKKDTNEHTVAFVWNGSSIDPVWILKDLNGHYARKEFSFLERSFASVNLKEDAKGRLAVTFTFPIGLEKPLYLVSTPGEDLNFAVVFKNEQDKLCKLEEIFVFMNEQKCLCRCREVNGPEFVETIPIDLGPVASFL